MLREDFVGDPVELQSQICRLMAKMVLISVMQISTIEAVRFGWVGWWCNFCQLNWRPPTIRIWQMILMLRWWGGTGAGGAGRGRGGRGAGMKRQLVQNHFRQSSKSESYKISFQILLGQNHEMEGILKQKFPDNWTWWARRAWKNISMINMMSMMKMMSRKNMMLRIL